MSSELFDPSAIRSNRSGEITQDQRDAIKSKFSAMPGWFTLGLMVVLFAFVFVTAGKFLMESTILGIGALVGIIIVAMIITSVLGGIVAMGRMSVLSVEPAPGQVVWKNNQYVAESRGRKLEPILGGSRDLQPGDYTFYVLRRSSWILSAESSNMAQPGAAPLSFEQMRAIVEKPLDFDPAQSPEKTARRMSELQQVAAQFRSMDQSRVSAVDIDRLKEMGQAMGRQMNALMAGQGGSGNMLPVMQAVNQSALPAMDSHGMDELRRALEQSGVMKSSALGSNRRGQLTGGQRATLMSSLWLNLLIAVVALALAILVGGGAYLEGNIQVALAGGGFGLLVGVALLIQAGAALSDWAGGRAKMVETIVAKYTRTSSDTRSRNPTTYYFEVNKQRFSVSRPAYEALIEGRVYKVYMTPNAKKLLNIEPV